MEERRYYVYILASRSRILYAGVTNHLVRRIQEHREGVVSGFTSHYRVHRLVYFEVFRDVRMAIAREKQIKGWSRAKKINLIEDLNPSWQDLADRFFSPFPRFENKQVLNREEKADPSLRRLRSG
jgi:putative endonuclease